jgi:hypothetical protein
VAASANGNLGGAQADEKMKSTVIRSGYEALAAARQFLQLGSRQVRYSRRTVQYKLGTGRAVVTSLVTPVPGRAGRVVTVFCDVS